MNTHVVFLIAPIGAGKGTQADVLVKRFGFFHVETSKLIEERFNDPDMAERKKQWESGALIDPAWVTQLVIEEVKKLIKAGQKLVFSSSPRTLLEAEQEMPVFEELFGKNAILIFNILLSEQESIKRNSGRRICEKNRHPIPNFPETKNLTVCPEDGSLLIGRGKLDEPQTIKIRYQEYLTRTEPILKYLKERGHEVVSINGEQPIADVSRDILKHLEAHHRDGSAPASPLSHDYN